MRSRSAVRPPDPRVFAALGDPTRIALVERLHRAPALSITALAEGTSLTRQAITKHLRVLSDAGLVRDERHGRERLWSLDGLPLRDVAAWAESYRRHWEDRLDRLDVYLQQLQAGNAGPDEEDPR